MKRSSIFLVSLIVGCSSIYAMEQEKKTDAIIEPYNKERDGNAIAHILRETELFQCFYKLGRLEQAINSSQYITSVCRRGNETVGFVNYLILDLQKNLGKYGTCAILHLVGVKREYQRKGYGKILFSAAMEDLKQKGIENYCLDILPHYAALTKKLNEHFGFNSRDWHGTLFLTKAVKHGNEPTIDQASDEDLEMIDGLLLRAAVKKIEA